METPGAAKPSVLLLEDEAPLAEAMVQHLMEDFDVERAANAEEAKLLLATREFDILLCDHMMPGGQQGLDFLIEAMARHPKSRRILLTGYMNPDLISRSIALAGLSECLIKPVSFVKLRELLFSVLDRPVQS